jgi:hypothetical protein
MGNPRVYELPRWGADELPSWSERRERGRDRVRRAGRCGAPGFLSGSMSVCRVEPTYWVMLGLAQMGRGAAELLRAPS